MSDFLQQRVKKATQARTDDAYWTERSQFQSPEHRDAFEKWFDKEYGGAVDVGYYRTGRRNDKLRLPTSEEYYTAKNQFDYDRKGLYPDLNYDPFRRDKLENEAWKTYLKTRGYQNFDKAEFSRTYTRLKYKDQYDMSIAEDAQAYETGDKPYRYQMSEKAANEYKQLLSDIDNGTLGQSWREKYKTLAAYDAYALNTAKEAAAAKAKEDKRRQDALDNGEQYVEPFTSPLTGTKKAKSSPLDLDTLKELGWDENTGFGWIDRAIIDRQQAINDRAAAAKAPAQAPAPAPTLQPRQKQVYEFGLPGATVAQWPKFGQQGMPNFRQLESATNNALDRPVSFREAEGYANADIAQTPAGKTYGDVVKQQQKDAEWLGYVDQQPDWLKPLLGNDVARFLYQELRPVSEVINANNPATAPVTYIVGTLSALMKNGMKALQDTGDQKKPEWQGKLTATGWKDLPDPIQMAVQGWNRNLEQGVAPFTGDPAAERKLYDDVQTWLKQPGVGQTLVSLLGEAVYDPTSYVPGALRIKGTLSPSAATAGRKLASAGAELEAAAARRLQQADRQLGSLGGIKGEGLPANMVNRPAIAPAPRRLPTPTLADDTWRVAPDRTTGEMLATSADGNFAIRASGGKFKLYETADDAGKTTVRPRGEFDTLPEAKAAATGGNAPRVVQRATIDSGPTIGKNTSTAPDAIVRPDTGPRNVAAAADDAATLTGKPTKQMEIGKPGQKSFDAQRSAPEGMNERGLSENIRTDANSPDALRDSYSQDPEFYKVVTNKDTLAKAQAIYDKGPQAARTELAGMIDRMEPEAVPLAKMLARDATAAGNVAEAREILSSVASKLTEAGQFGQAARILRQSDPETVFMTLDKQLKKLNEQGRKIYNKKWKDFNLLPDEADELAKIKPGDEPAIEKFMQKVSDRIADQMPATALEKLTAWRHMAMLLNPKTHIRNIAGNALMAGLNRVSSRTSGFMQRIFLKRELRTAAPIVRKEAKQLAAEFFAKHEKELLTGSNKYNEGIGLNMPNKRVFKARPIEAVRKFNYKALDVEDKFFFKRAYIDRLASALQARGVKSLDDIPQDILKLAVNEAEKAVFRDKSNLANAIGKLKQGKGGFLWDTVMPFTKTPISIAKRGVDYSPVGVLRGVGKLFKPTTAAEGIDDLAKGLTGTGVMALGYFLADAGILTGAAPKDKDLADYERATGQAPFSILGEYTYDWAQPVAIPLTVGVAIHDALTDDPQTLAKLRRAVEASDTETINKIAGGYGLALLDAFNAAGDTMFNMSVLQGIQDLFANQDGISAGLAKLPANYINQMIPTAAGQLARAIDPTVRQTYYGATDPRTQTATIINKVPFASRTLPPRITPFGQEQRGIENPILRTLNSFLNPSNMPVRQDIDPQVDAELRRLYDQGQIKQFPTTVDRMFKFMDKAVSLTDAEYAQYQRTTGQETIKAFKDIINSDEYRQIPKKELNEKLKALAATRGTTVQILRNDSKVLDRIQEEYRAFLLAKGIQYAKALGQLEILRKRGMIGNLTDKQLADRMGVSKEIAGKIN